jgi:hypothetical protein
LHLFDLFADALMPGIELFLGRGLGEPVLLAADFPFAIKGEGVEDVAKATPAPTLPRANGTVREMM